MALNDIIAQLDAEIARLQQVKSLLAASNSSASSAAVSIATEARRGRPKKSAEAAAPAKPSKKKRNLTPEGRARIAEAVKRRWAAQKGSQEQA